MKTAYAWFVLSFLLFGFACTKPSSVEAGLVLDTHGDILRPGVEYYILPYIFAMGGGLTMEGVNGNENCSRAPAVLQERLEVLNGLPVTFSTWNSKLGFIPTSLDLNIKFSVSSVCPNQSTVWKITKSDDSEIQWFVTTGGVEGNHGPDTVTNWFQIEKAGSFFYKLKFCPSICCGFLCRDIGRYVREDGTGILSLSDALSPFYVVFVKKGSPESSI